jgi:hypothetical protein
MSSLNVCFSVFWRLPPCRTGPYVPRFARPLRGRQWTGVGSDIEILRQLLPIWDKRASAGEISLTEVSEFAENFTSVVSFRWATLVGELPIWDSGKFGIT